MPMLDSVKTAFKLPDLRKKILFTVAMLFIYRLGSNIPVPGFGAIDFESGSVFGLLDMMAGGALRKMSLFALNVYPYITASIIMTLLQMVVPRLGQLAKEGVEGKRKLTQYQRYGSIVLAAVQAWAYASLFRGSITDSSFFGLLQIVIVMTAGSMILMWVGELIQEYGVGNGLSLIIFAGIVARFIPNSFRFITTLGTGGVQYYEFIVYVIGAVALVALVVAVNEGQRKIPVQYAKRVIGRKMYGGQSTHIPLRVNQTSVIPIIFAVSMLAFPPTLASFFPGVEWIQKIKTWFDAGSLIYLVVFGILVFLFTFFYTAVTFNPVEVANNLKKYSGFIPGIRPGRPTAEYLDRVLTRLTFSGAIFLTFIALLPQLATAILPGINAGFSGTALLIAVGVAIDTMRQIESHLLMRQYEGFLK